MRIPRLKLFLILFWILLGASCGGQTDRPEGPTPPFPISDPTLMPIFDVVITVKPPDGTAADANLAMVILDEVTGWPHNSTILPMAKLDDGRWQISLNPPAGSLLRYRYIRQNPEVAFEADTEGATIQNRIVHISGSTHVQDLIATWSGKRYQGPTGRVIGRLVNAQTGDPLSEMVVNVGGNTVFTDGLGNFRVDGLVPGLHTITAFSADGSFSPAQQGAVVAADSTTPAQMSLFPAKKVQVTFEVTVPDDTLEGIPLRFAGNLQQFGHLFTELPGGITHAVALMPTLIEVDPTHYVFIADLYAGTDFRYKYTLGDGLINTERGADGALVTREVIIPDTDVVIRDTIERWQGKDQGTVLFWLEVPSSTPITDVISLQLNSTALSSPIPMWKIGDQQWFYTVYGHPESEGEISYRYCRNQQCGIADDIQSSGSMSDWRTFLPNDSQIDLRDTVVEWSWWKEREATSYTPSPQIAPLEGFNVGVELLPRYNPSWEAHLDIGLKKIADMGANSIILTPSWLVGDANPVPEVGFDPTHAPFFENLRTVIEKAQILDLQVVLHPTLTFGDQDYRDWWQSTLRDDGWWSVWFERYKAFVITYAGLAADMGISKIILGGPELAPSLPEGVLFDGTPSGTPPETDAVWREIISEVRSIYPGRIGLELDLGSSLQTPPTFIDAVDEIYLYWHAPIASSTSAGIQAYQSTVRSIITSSVLTSQSIVGKPIFLSVEYPSIDGTAMDCSQALADSCLDASAFDLGSEGNAFLQVNLKEQAEAIYAILAEAYVQPSIHGVYVRRYNPIVELNDKSASINGKPGQLVLEIWYPQITGQ